MDSVSFVLARRARSLEKDDIHQMMKKMAGKFKPVFDEDDEEEENSTGESRESNANDEKKMMIQANDGVEKSEEADSSEYIHTDEEEVAHESDES